MTDKDTTMKEPIQRYSQGFGGFGVLEKCNDGKIVMYADHSSEVSRLTSTINSFVYDDTANEILVSEQSNEILELKLNICDLKVYLLSLSFIAATLLAIIVFVK
jgi:hypothetical protein